MKEEYRNILNEMARNDSLLQHIDGRNLLSYLLTHDVISYQEKEKLRELGPTECIQRLIKLDLMTRKDEDMKHFLNSLKQAKYDDAFDWLKQKLEKTSLLNDHQHVQLCGSGTTSKPKTESDKKKALENIANVFYESFNPYPRASVLLETRKVFSHEDVETIRIQPSQFEKNYTFLRIIQSRLDWFEQLLKVLEETGQHDLLVRLKNELDK